MPSRHRGRESVHRRGDPARRALACGHGDAPGIVGGYHREATPSASLRPDSARAPASTFVMPPGWRPSVGLGALSSDEAGTDDGRAAEADCGGGSGRHCAVRGEQVVEHRPEDYAQRHTNGATFG